MTYNFASKSIACLLAFSLLMTSCSKDNLYNDRVENLINSNPNTSYQDLNNINVTKKSNFEEELFKSIVFLNGDFLKEITYLHNISLSINDFKGKEFNKLQDDFIAEMKLQNPDFFKEFEKSILYGSAKDIEETLKNSTKNLHSFILKKASFETVDLDNVVKEYYPNSNYPDFNETETAGVGIALLVTVVIAIGLVINVMVNYTINDDEESFPMANTNVYEIDGNISKDFIILDIKKAQDVLIKHKRNILY